MNMKYVWLNIWSYRSPRRVNKERLFKVILALLLLIGLTFIWTRFSHRVGATSPYWQAVMSDDARGGE